MQNPLIFSIRLNKFHRFSGMNLLPSVSTGFNGYHPIRLGMNSPPGGNKTDGDCRNAVKPVEIPALPLPRKWRDIVSMATAIILTTLVRWAIEKKRNAG